MPSKLVKAHRGDELDLIVPITVDAESLQWLHDGKPYDPKRSDARFERDPNAQDRTMAILHFDAIAEDNGGRYQLCHAGEILADVRVQFVDSSTPTTAAGSGGQRVMLCEETTEVIRVDQDATEIRARLGDELELHVPFSLANGAPADIRWWKDGERLVSDNGERYELAERDEEATLTVRQVEMRDAGRYELTVEAAEKASDVVGERPEAASMVFRVKVGKELKSRES